jgi:hypothetical protein
MGRPSPMSAVDPANTAGLAIQPTAVAQYPHLPYLLSASPADEWDPAVIPLHPHHLHLFPAAGQPSRTAPGHATGRPRQPGGPHAEGRCVRIWVGIGHRVGNDPIASHTARTQGVAQAAATGATCPARRTARGTGGKSPRAARGLASKGARQANRGCQATNPIGVFSTPSPLLAQGEKGKGMPLHRTGERRTRASRERGAGSEEPELRRTTAGVDVYPACAHPFTEPATTTLPPHREHRTATMFSPPP